MIVFTTPKLFHNEEFFLNALFSEGMEILHLRKPNASLQEVTLFLSQIKEKYHSRIVMHSHFDLLKDFKLKGICFSEVNKFKYARYAGQNILKIWPAHSVEALKTVPDGIDYVLLSPLYESISKSGYSRKWTIDDFAIYMKQNSKRNFRLVALGGIDEHNIKDALALGFDDVAVLGGLWNSMNGGLLALVQQYKKLKEICNN